MCGEPRRAAKGRRRDTVRLRPTAPSGGVVLCPARAWISSAVHRPHSVPARSWMYLHYPIPPLLNAGSSGVLVVLYPQHPFALPMASSSSLAVATPASPTMVLQQSPAFSSDGPWTPGPSGAENQDSCKPKRVKLTQDIRNVTAQLFLQILREASRDNIPSPDRYCAE